MAWNIENNRSVYIQLVEHIQKRILSGEYAPGDKLPSVRELAKDAGVNPNTMQRAFQELERQGLVYANRTSGRFITDNQTVLKNAAEQQAHAIVEHYYVQMRDLGFDKEAMITMLEQYEENQDERKGEQ